MTFSLTGDDALIAKLLDIVNPARIAVTVDKGAASLETRAKRLAPRKTGLLEDEITTIHLAALLRGVGVPSYSAAIVRAWVTEGLAPASYVVTGTPNNPRLEWRSQTKAGSTMPWLHTAALEEKDDFALLVSAHFHAEYQRFNQ